MVIRYTTEKNDGLSVVTGKVKTAVKAESISKYMVVFLLWMVCYFTYFGLQYSLFAISNDIIWLNFSLFGFVELFGMYFASLVSKRMKRVMAMRVFLVIAAFACLLNTMSSKLPSLNLLLFIGKLKSC